jgi:hypothetical protein
MRILVLNYARSSQLHPLHKIQLHIMYLGCLRDLIFSVFITCSPHLAARTNNARDNKETLKVMA